MKEFISINSKVQQTARRVVTLQDSVPCMRGRESKIHMIKSTQVVVKNNNQEEEVEVEKDSMASENDTLMKLREVLGIVDRHEIHRVLQSYIETIEIMHCYFPSMSTQLKVDYAMSYAINPGWYGEGLLDRLTNIILLSSLLLVVTVPAFMDPPFPEDTPKDDNAFRCFFYVTGLSNILFLTSIVLSVCFIENGMSRAYGRAEKLVLTIKQYHLKDIAQILVILGTVGLFPYFLSMTMWERYEDKDANVMITLVTISSILSLLLFVYYSTQAGGEQVSRIQIFMEITNASDGRLLPAFCPEKLHENDGITYLTPEEFNCMYKDISSYQQGKKASLIRM